MCHLKEIKNGDRKKESKTDRQTERKKELRLEE